MCISSFFRCLNVWIIYWEIHKRERERSINESDFLKCIFRTDNPSLALVPQDQSIQVQRLGWKWPVIIIIEFSQPSSPRIFALERKRERESEQKIILRDIFFIDLIFKKYKECRFGIQLNSYTVIYKKFWPFLYCASLWVKTSWTNSRTGPDFKST